MDVKQLRKADAYFCGVKTAPSKTKHLTAGLGVFATRTIKTGDVIGPYSKTIVYHDLSLRQRTRRYSETEFWRWKR